MDDMTSSNETPQSWQAGYEGPETANEVPAEEEILVLEHAPAALTLDVWEPTGDPAVDSALERLAAVPSADLATQVEIFSTIHDELRARLTDLTN